MVYCCVAGCNKRTGDNCSFFRFPFGEGREKLMKVWVTKINRVDQSSGPASDKMWKPHKTSVVCSQHFTPNCFTTNPEIAQMCGFTDMKRLRLEKEAYPTIFPKSQTESEREVKRQASPYAMPFHSTPKRQAFQKREHQRILAEAFAEFDVCHKINKEPASDHAELDTCSHKEPDIDANQVDHTNQESIQDIKENSHVDNDVLLDISNLPRRTRDSFQQTYTPKLYVKSTQTKKRTTEQGSQTTGPLKTCSVGTMTDPIQTRLVLPFIPPARAGESFTPETRSKFESNGSFEECIDDEWQPGIGDSDEDIDLDEDEEDEDLNETAEFRETDIDITESTDGPVAERKYIVFESCLQILLSICRFCSQPCSVVLKQMCGSGATFECSCPKGHLFKWQSQPVHCKMPLGNLVVSSGILFTGSSPKAVINLFEQCNIACMTDRTYRNIQSCYLIPAVHNVWEGNNTVELQMCREGNVKVGGDARFCSPGHTAKYASYSLMNMETGVILATELVQVTEVKNSCHMELEGLKKCLAALKQAGVMVSDLITDRHSMVKSYMKKEQPSIRHWFDVWHVAKGVFKKLIAVSKKRDCSQIADWAHSISNHMYWAASSSNGNGEMVLQKWQSILNHVCNKHEGHGDLFPTCQHEEITKDVCWLKMGSKVYKELQDVITSNFLMNDIKKLSPGEQTSDLEAFHSLVCQFVPKSTHYFYDAMKARLLVAALHSNENAQRSQAFKRDGTPRYRLSYPKAKKGEHCLKVVKEGCTYDYVMDLMEEAYDLRQEFQSYSLARKGLPMSNSPPPPLTSQVNRVSLEEALARHKARFNKSH